MFILRSYKSIQKSHKSVYNRIKVYKITQQSSTQTKTLITTQTKTLITVILVTKGITDMKIGV